MSTFFSATTLRSFSFAVLGYIFVFQTNCHRKEMTASQHANKTANVSNVNSSSNISKLTNTNGYFVLYYGDGKDEEQLKSDFERIRKTQPAFVVVGYFGEKSDGPVDLKQAKQVLCVLRGGSAKDCVRNPSFAVNRTGIKTIYYVTADQLDSIVSSQVKSVMDLGYDGIFFDETNLQTQDSQNNRYKNFANSVHHFNNERDKKIVIVNPGVSDVSVCRMFEYADIVSVENHWNKVVPQCSGIDKSRWLAVQGDPSDEGDYAQPPHDNEPDKAIKRLNCFRKNGGLWYFTTGWTDKGEPVHWRLPQFLEKFAAEAKKESMNCSE
jgi:hypothetical protein